MCWLKPAHTALVAHDRARTVLSHVKPRAPYLPFGYQATPGMTGQLGYTGQRREPWGVYPLGNGRRLYQPIMMRFCQPDALSPFARGGPNAYTYCQGDPVNRHDPGGQEALDLLGDIMGALGIVAYGAMMLTGYRVSPPSKLMVGVDATLMAGSSVAWIVGIATDSDAAKIASIAATALTALGRGALAVQWGRQAFRRRPPRAIELVDVLGRSDLLVRSHAL
ncbi:RHS repeat-associated core domain-containing protein [Pseudomonas sp. Marseille-Q5115]|uniref:RHS repeat-associated core domain-containing protein n=1 Tax=Pseudomonas sp. Marseille-Q5115 TaxID=2866593 RepID=UPI001CE3D796|nr:RHS repeat-associated core domain-containing protein [Pseudomonas sp. Marseille-Q5115]